MIFFNITSIALTLMAIFGISSSFENIYLAEQVSFSMQATSKVTYHNTSTTNTAIQKQHDEESDSGGKFFLLGVMRPYFDYYREAALSGKFICLSTKDLPDAQKRTITFSKVNDNFCDCEDGSDEPGTSACSMVLRNPEGPTSVVGNAVNINDDYEAIHSAFIMCNEEGYGGGPANAAATNDLKMATESDAQNVYNNNELLYLLDPKRSIKECLTHLLSESQGQRNLDLQKAFHFLRLSVTDKESGDDQEKKSSKGIKNFTNPTEKSLPWRFRCTSNGQPGVDRYLLHSRVNDGFCDCCDGSDENGLPEIRENNAAHILGISNSTTSVNDKMQFALPPGAHVRDRHNRLVSSVAFGGSRRCPNICEYVTNMEKQESDAEHLHRSKGLKNKVLMLNKSQERLETIKNYISENQKELEMHNKSLEDLLNEKIINEERENQQRAKMKAKYDNEKVEWEKKYNLQLLEAKKQRLARIKDGEQKLKELRKQINGFNCLKWVGNNSIDQIVDSPHHNVDDKIDGDHNNDYDQENNEEHQLRPNIFNLEYQVLACDDVIDNQSKGYCLCLKYSAVADGIVVPIIASTITTNDSIGDFHADVSPSPYPENTTVKFYYNFTHPRFRCGDVCDGKNSSDYLNLIEVTNSPLVIEEWFQGDDGSSFTLPEANEFRNKFQVEQARIFELQEKIQHLSEEYLLLENASVEEKALRSLHYQCFLFKSNDFDYSMCPFDNATQGHINIGLWKGFGEQTYSSWGAQHDYSIMRFTDGTTTWSGTVRETTVLNKCGPENKILTVEETTTGKYKMVMETPALCE